MPLTNPAAPAPSAPAGPPPAPRTYPRILYQYSDTWPGFTYLKVESAEQEAAVLAGDQTAIAQAKQAQQQPPGTAAKGEKGEKGEAPPDDKGWYDTPEEARYARARAHLPYVEFGREIPAPLLAAFVPAAAQPASGDTKYPKLKYQAIEEAPGFKYVKMTSADDESALAGSGSGTWYDTPAEAIANPPVPAKAPKPAPEGGGGTPAPATHGGADAPAKTNGGKHRL